MQIISAVIFIASSRHPILFRNVSVYSECETPFHTLTHVDDVFGFHKTKEEATRALAIFEGICRELGVLLKLAKKVEPTQRITLVGWIFDSVEMSISLPLKKRKSISSLCNRSLLQKDLSLKDLQILGGNLNHAAVVIPGASLRLQWCGRATSIAIRKKRYVLSDYDRRQLFWWIVQLNDPSTMTRITPATMRPVTNVWTDSSDYFAGSIASNGTWSSYLWPSAWMPTAIFIKELAAFICGVISSNCPQGSLVRGFIDNSVAWSCLALHKSNNHSLKFFNLCLQHRRQRINESFCPLPIRQRLGP